MAKHAVARTTIAMGIGTDKPRRIMPSIIKGRMTKYQGMKYDGMPRHPLCRTYANGPGM